MARIYASKVRPERKTSVSLKAVKRQVMSPEALQNELGRTIHHLRLKNELTQGQVGEALGLKRSAVAMMEAGRQGITLYNLLVLAALFDTPIVDMVPEEVRSLVMGLSEPSDSLSPKEVRMLRERGFFSGPAVPA